MLLIIIICLILFLILFLIGIKLFIVDEKSNDIIIDETKIDYETEQNLENPKICKYFLCSNYASGIGLVPDVCNNCLHKTQGL